MRGKHRPEALAARNTDPGTSHLAAASLKPSVVRSYQLRILSTIARSGGALAAIEVADLNGWTYEKNGCYWKRQSELLDMGLLENVEKHLGPKNRWVNAAEITELGVEWLNHGGSIK